MLRTRRHPDWAAQARERRTDQESICIVRRYVMFAQRLGLPNLRGTRSFVVATFIDFLGTGLFLPFSLLYFTRAVGLPLPAVGLALSIAMTITLPLVPVTGLLIDRFGTRRVVLLAQFLQGAGFLGYLVVLNVPMLLGMVLLNAIGQRLFWSAYFTLMAEIAAPHERDRWYGLGAATRNAGLGLGGLLAGVVVGANAILGYHLVVIADALSFFLAAGLLLFGVRVTSPQRSDGPQRSGYKLILRDRAFLVLVPRAFLIPFLFIVTCVYALAELIHDPTSNALAADIGQESLRGRYLALFQLSWSVAGLIAPGLFAVLFTLRPVLPWLVMATLILLASLTIHWIEPHLPRQAVRRP